MFLLRIVSPFGWLCQMSVAHWMKPNLILEREVSVEINWTSPASETPLSRSYFIGDEGLYLPKLLCLWNDKTIETECMKGDNKIGFLTMWKIQAFIARSAVTLHAVMMKHLPRNFLVDAGPSTYSAIPLVCFNLPNVLMQNNGNIPF